MLKKRGNKKGLAGTSQTRKFTALFIEQTFDTVHVVFFDKFIEHII
jgi:hypothetical protein